MMNISDVKNFFRRKYYKKVLEKYVGHKLPTVTVMGSLDFENGTLEIGENVILYPNVTFSGNGHICIGNGCKIGKDVIFYARKGGGINIGNNSIIAAQTYIIDSNHKIGIERMIVEQGLESQCIEIGDDVWIGANATVILGSKINTGAVIGAKALVNSEIDEYSIAVGIPARVIKKRPV